MSTFLFMFYMLQDCDSTRTIRAYALYKWKEPTLSLRADPTLYTSRSTHARSYICSNSCHFSGWWAGIEKASNYSGQWR